MNGKVVMVTGATGGIGRVTAEGLARQGATVIVVGRDRERAARVVDEIMRKTANVAVEFLVADLSRQEDVRRLAEAFARRHQHLHVLVNNAGAVFGRREETVDGLEMTFALNHLAPFLLTNLLLDTLKASAPARVITVSSGAHVRARLDFDDLQNRRRYSGLRVYGQSKLCNLLFTYELARRLEGTGVTANALHPGFVATDFGRARTGLIGRLMPLAHRFAISPQEGASTSVYLASSAEVEGVSGRYFYKRRPVASSPASYDVSAAHRLWRVSSEMTGLPPG